MPWITNLHNVQFAINLGWFSFARSLWCTFLNLLLQAYFILFLTPTSLLSTGLKYPMQESAWEQNLLPFRITGFFFTPHSLHKLLPYNLLEKEGACSSKSCCQRESCPASRYTQPVRPKAPRSQLEVLHTSMLELSGDL